jgi:hypothetical protein
VAPLPERPIWEVWIRGEAFAASRLSMMRPQVEGTVTVWPAPGSEDAELGVFMEPEVGHGETKVYAGVQA